MLAGVCSKVYFSILWEILVGWGLFVDLCNIDGIIAPTLLHCDVPVMMPCHIFIYLFHHIA